jgi:hypothetical protein
MKHRNSRLNTEVDGVSLAESEALKFLADSDESKDSQRDSQGTSRAKHSKIRALSLEFEDETQQFEQKFDQTDETSISSTME